MSESLTDKKTEVAAEEAPPQAQSSKWKLSKAGDGDTAMTLFTNPEDMQEEFDPKEERKLLWKIDFMILPYLAVCYAFFYIDKVSLENSNIHDWTLSFPLGQSERLAYFGVLCCICITDDSELCGYLRYTRGPESTWNTVQLAEQHFLFRIFVLGIPNESDAATLPCRYVTLSPLFNADMGELMRAISGKYLGINIFLW